MANKVIGFNANDAYQKLASDLAHRKRLTVSELFRRLLEEKGKQLGMVVPTKKGEQ